MLANDRDADGDELTVLNATASAGVVRIVDNKRSISHLLE